MAQFSVKIISLTGSVLGENQHKGVIKFVKGDAASNLGLASDRSKYGYLCVECMELATNGETVDPDTGEVSQAHVPVRPSHYKCAQTGALLPVENPAIWVYPEGGEA